MDKKPPILFPLLAALIAAFLYAKTSNYQFAYDDILRIEYNPLVNTSLDKSWNFKEILKSPAPPGDLYRPVSTLSYRLNFLISGVDASSYHVFNIILFALCVFLISRIFLWLIDDKIAAICASLIFTVHPICTEAVANIVGRQEILVAVFGLASLTWLWRSYDKKPILFFLGLLVSLFAFVLAIHSKESAYVFALIIPLTIFFWKKEIDKKLIFSTISFLLIAAACLIIRFYVLADKVIITSDHSTVFFENPMFHLGFIDRIVPGLYLLGKYTQLILMPFHQSANYSMQPEMFFGNVYSLLGLLLVVSVLILGVLAFRLRRKTWGVFALWFFLAFSLTLNLFTPIGTLMGERLAFLPSIGLIGFLVPMIFWISKKVNFNKALIPSLFLLLIILFAFRTSERMQVWKDHGGIYKATAIDAPYSPKAAFNLGIHYFVRENNFPAAKRELLRAIDLAPNYVKAMHLLLKIAQIEKKQEDIKLWVSEILKVHPEDELALSLKN